MNEIVKKILLEGDKFMPEIHLRLPAFTKTKEKIKKFKETGDS